MITTVDEMRTSMEPLSSSGSVPYTFDAGGPCTIRVAASIDDRRRAWRLVYKEYLEKNYAVVDSRGLWYGIHDSLPSTTTFLVERDDLPVAALTLVFDGPLGIPADELYAGELDGLRREGRKPCELVSLVHVDSSRSTTATVLSHLFKLAYTTARYLEQATDFVITVNPHHTAYYRKRLLFDVAGDEKSYGKVSGAPAVLLRLDLGTAEAQYRAHYARRSPARDFHRFFTSGIRELVPWLASSRRPLDPVSLRRWFPSRRLVPADNGVAPKSLAFLGRKAIT